MINVAYDPNMIFCIELSYLREDYLIFAWVSLAYLL